MSELQVPEYDVGNWCVSYDNMDMAWRYSNYCLVVYVNVIFDFFTFHTAANAYVNLKSGHNTKIFALVFEDRWYGIFFVILFAYCTKFSAYRGRESLEEGILSPETNLGRSLLAGFCDRYQPDFVLHGTSDRSFLDKQLHSDLQLTLKVRVLCVHFNMNSHTIICFWECFAVALCDLIFVWYSELP